MASCETEHAATCCDNKPAGGSRWFRLPDFRVTTGKIASLGASAVTAVSVLKRKGQKRPYFEYAKKDWERDDNFRLPMPVGGASSDITIYTRKRWEGQPMPLTLL